MDISSKAEFSADPAAVYAMLTDEAFLTQVCKANNALDYEVAATADRTRTSRTLEAPATAAKFTGPTLTVVEEIAWGPAGADDSRTGQLSLTLPGQPVTMKGTVQLSPGGAGSTLTLTADLKVAIPLLGKKLEQSSAPAILAGFEIQKTEGNAWLS